MSEVTKLCDKLVDRQMQMERQAHLYASEDVADTVALYLNAADFIRAFNHVVAPRGSWFVIERRTPRSDKLVDIL